MYGIEDRIKRLVTEIYENLNEKCEVVDNVEILKERLDFPCDLTKLRGFSAYKDNAVWSCPEFDDYAVFKFKVKVPELKKGYEWGLEIKTNKDSGHNMVKPQMLLFAENECLCGLDTNHKRVPVNGYKRGDEICFYVYAFSGLSERTPYGGFVDMDTSEGVRLYVKSYVSNKALEDLYYNVNVPFTHLKFFDKNSYEYTKTIEELNEALRFVDFRNLYSEEFYDGVVKANEYLEENLYGENGSGKATLVGHTHIDLAWLWRYEHTVDKAVRSFATEVKLLKEFDEHRFMSSQAQLYEYVKEQNPKLYEEIKSLAKAGKWEAEGAMWVEPDMNLASGESIILQILYGKGFFREEFNKECKILWLPDVFGYTAALPQILKKSGIDYFMTCKLPSNELNRFPYDTFLWRGIDGTEVLSHLTTYISGYNPDIEGGEMITGWREYKQKNINDDILIPFGFADGGGGVSYAQMETVMRAKKGFPGMPEIKIGTVGNYFNRLDEKVSQNRKLPVWTGEIYYEKHRGTYTSMARIKRDNRRCEFLYSNANWLSVLADSICGFNFPKEQYEKGIKKMLLNQFHDVLPGTSIKEVYEDADLLYKEAFEIGNDICRNALSVLNFEDDKEKITVFNPFSQKVSGYVEINGEYVYAHNVPAKGYGVYSTKTTSPDYGVTVSGNTVENKYYIIQFNKNGEIESLYDKSAKRECFKSGKTANKLRIFEDKSSISIWGDGKYNEDNWNLESYYREHEYDMDSPYEISFLENGGEYVTVCVKRKYMNSEIIQNTIIYARSPRIDFKTEIDWNENSQVLKAEFPVDVNATRATYEVQFGYLERSTTCNNTWDEAKFEVCAHKWADVSDGGYGMSLLNDSKYGYNADGSTLSLTLLRCGNCPNPDADKEHHSFTYSILPHMGDIKEADVVKEAYMLNNPLFAVKGKAKLAEEFSLFECEGAILDTIKMAEEDDGYVLRFYEPYNASSSVNLTSAKKIKKAIPTDIMENQIDNFDVKIIDRGLEFNIKPFEIVTLKIWLGD